MSTALVRYRSVPKAMALWRGKRTNSTALSTALTMYLCFRGFYHSNLFWNFHIAANPVMLAAARQHKVVSEVVFGMLLHSPRLLASTPPVHQTYAMDPTLQGVSSFSHKISGPPVRPATLMNQSQILQASYMLDV
eukprot:TRINITY_DN14560_c0_g1_i1.p1 TRINITY_DN14560_c0_g1~~TRINITY_DN14560_c0_g1_i1.p1  ORF type:complete len:135 (+),score=20.52 TRINITY_DN14560_c0_g1_i1:40-444(+)